MKRMLAFLLGASLLHGCGASDSAFNPGSAALLASSDPQRLPLLLGKVAIGANAPGAQIQLLSLDGRPLGPQLNCDASGNFAVPAALLPQDFRVAAHLPNSAVTFYYEVRDNHGQARLLWINLLNHVLSLAMQQNPGLTLSQARQLARQRWKLADNFTFDEPISESGPFSQAIFYAKAGQAGGLGNYAAQVASQLSSPANPGQPPEFAYVGPSALQPPPEQSGLERELIPFAQAARGRLLITAEAPAGGFGSALLNLAQDELKDGILQGLGWIASSIGWNFFPGTTTFNIEKELEATGEELDRLSQLINVGFLDQQYRNLQLGLQTSAIIPLLTAAQQLASIQKNTLISNRPFLLNPGQANLFSALTTSNLTLYLNTLQSSLSGAPATNLVASFLQLQMANLGLDQPAEYQQFPVRSLVLRQQNPLDYYQQWQNLATYLLAEAAHVNLTAQTPLSSQIAIATATLDQAAFLLKQQAQQLPGNLPDNVLLDTEFGLMYYMEIQAPTSFQAASTFVDNLSVGGYDDWVLPSGDDCSQRIQQRGRYVAGSDGDYGNTVEGLGKLGLAIDSFPSSDPDIWVSDNASSGKAKYFRLNHEHSIDNEDSDFLAGPHCVLAVRHFPNPNPGSPDLTPAGLRAGATVSGASPTPLSLSIGTTGTLSLAGNNVTATQLHANGVYLARSGGKFTAGTPSKNNDYNQALVKAPLTSVEVTDLVAWNITDRAPTAQILNQPGYEGQLIWQPAADGTLANVTVQASLAGTDANGNTTVHTQTLVVTPPNPRPVKQLKSLLISPRNVLYTSFPLAGNNQYRAYAFYNDNTVLDVTESVTWTAVSSLTGQPINNVTMSSNTQGVLTINALPSDGNIRVQATFSGNSDNTTVELALP